MPFEIGKNVTNINRCFVCKKIVTNPYAVIKTCCVNKPIIFCSKTCKNIWERSWLKRQEQIGKVKNIKI